VIVIVNAIVIVIVIEIAITIVMVPFPSTVQWYHGNGIRQHGNRKLAMGIWQW